jgi:RecA/RadA recombinase
MKPFDLSKFRKSVNKSLKITDGYHDPEVWIDTGNYALNKMISGDFFRGVPLGKVTVFAGESGSGKSFICSGNLVRSCQKAGILPVILDSEYAIDKAWLKALEVDVDMDKLMRWPVDTVDDCATIVGEFMKQYVDEYSGVPKAEQQPVLFIIDSLGMLSTPTEVDQFNKGEMKGDMGRKAKQLKALVTQCLKLMGPYNIGMVATNHTYKSQDMFNPDDVISGGSGFIFASSIVVAMQKLKLKEDADGNKTSQVHGIRSKMKCVKSRYAKPFEEVQVQIPYETGMSPFSGLFDMFESKGILTKDGNRYKYRCTDGTEIKKFRKEYGDDDFMRIMLEFDDSAEDVGVGTDLDAPEEE